MRSEGFTGPCIRDSSITLPATCVGNVSLYMESQGYRKVAGDVCVGGLEASFSPQSRPCCGNNGKWDVCIFPNCPFLMRMLVGVNECLHQPSLCDVNASCTDTDSSYQCTCQVGYSGDGLVAGSGCSGECLCNNCMTNIIINNYYFLWDNGPYAKFLNRAHLFFKTGGWEPNIHNM